MAPCAPSTAAGGGLHIGAPWTPALVPHGDTKSVPPGPALWDAVEVCEMGHPRNKRMGNATPSPPSAPRWCHGVGRAQNHPRVPRSPRQGPAGCSHGHGGGGSAALSALAANTKSIGHVPAPAGPSAEGSSQGWGRRRGGSARGGGRAVPSQSPPRRCLHPAGAVPRGGPRAVLPPSMLAVVAGLRAAGVQSAAVLTEGKSSRLWPMEAEGWGQEGDRAHRHGDGGSEVMGRGWGGDGKRRSATGWSCPGRP